MTNKYINWILVSIFNKHHQRFKHLYSVNELLNRRKDIQHIEYKDGELELSAYPKLKGIIFNGHGVRDKAELTDDDGRFLTPSNIKLPGKNLDIFLLLCHQGTEPVKKLWAKGLNLDISRIYGAIDTTETAFSILFLLNLQKYGFKRTKLWFDKWNNLNDHFRPYMDQIRKIYRTLGCNFAKAFSVAKSRFPIPLKYIDFFGILQKAVPFLDGIL